jgi:cobalt-zinc-cadmium efflux system outer membrane protein
MKRQPPIVERTWTAISLAGLLGLIVAASSVSASGPADASSRGTVQTAARDRIGHPQIERADGEPTDRRLAAPYSARPNAAPSRYDYPSVAGGDAPPAAIATPRTRSPDGKPDDAPALNRLSPVRNDNSVGRSVALSSVPSAGPVLKPAHPAMPVRQIASRARYVQQEAIPPGAATPTALPSLPGVSSRRLQTPLGPGADGGISLDQAGALAIQNNPILRSAAAQIESARGQAIQAGLWNNPRWDTNNPQVLGSGRSNQYNAGFVLEIPTAGKKRLDRSAAEQQVRQAIFDYRTDRMNMLTAVRQQFYGLLAQQRRVEISRELVEIARKAQSIAQAMKGIGLQADVDVLPLAIEFQRAEAALLQAERILEGRRRQLAATIGLPNLPIERAVGSLDRQFPQINEAALREFVATRHPRILTASAEIDRRQILLRRAEVEPIPNPYTGPAAAWGPTTNPTQFWYNFQFNIPIWNLNQGGRRAAAADIRDARASLVMLQNDLLRQAAQAYARYRAAHTLAERYGREILPLALQNQELNREAYEKREFEPLRYLLAQRLLTESYLEYIDALEEVWNSAAELGNLMMIEQFP